MDFLTLKRRDLQVLCKKNNIPANTTNAVMADALASLDFVEGIEEFMRQTEVKDVSPERSVTTSPNMLRTSTRQRVCIEESECSKLATRTRCSTRRNAVAGTESKQTPATRTSRRTARKIQHDIQAEYEASLDESQVSENKELVSNECESVEESKLSEVVDQDDNASSENQSESQGQLNDHEEDVSEAQEKLPSEMLNANVKVDFHNLSRKQLQNLCKRNKIPANITNAAMIDALEALESVEGLEDLLKESDPAAVMSPEMCRMTSFRARQSRTAQKTTHLKHAHTFSALGKMSVLKKQDDCLVVQSLSNKMDSTMEDIESSVEDVSKEVENVEQNHVEALPEMLGVFDSVSEKDADLCAESKALPETCIVAETQNEALDDVVDEGSSPTITDTCVDALVAHTENPLSKIDNPSQEDALETNEDDHEFEANEPVEVAANNERLESNSALLNHPNSDEGESQLQSDEESDSCSMMMENVKELQDDVIENESSETEEAHESSIEELASKPVADQEEFILSEALVEKRTVNEEAVGLMPEAEGFEVSDNSILEDMQEDAIILQDDDDDDTRGGDEDDMEILNQLGDRVDEMDGIGFGDTDSNVEEVGDVESVEGSKSILMEQQDEDTLFDSDSVDNSMEKQESGCLEINSDKESEMCDDKADEAINVNECGVEKLEDAPKPKGTPLNHKSLRKLKKLLKEKLQTSTTLLTSKMEKLTLVEEVEEVCENMKEECDDQIETSCVVSTIVSGIAKASEPAMVTGKDDVDEELTQIIVDKAVNDTAVVDATLQIQICTESVNSNSALKQTTQVVIPHHEVGVECMQFSPLKSLRKTPSKATMSSGRKDDAVDIASSNKENIDKSASKTGPGKVEIPLFGTQNLLSPISMRKLKKELQQQSEKKRVALKSRSENQCPLSSP